MAKKYLVSLDLSKNELLNARVQNLATAPSSPVTGQEYFDTALGKLGVFNGSTWDYMGTSTATGDFSSNTASSVDGEVVVFSGTSGKTGKRATGTGLAKLTSGVLSTATSGTDYAPATSGTAILKGNGSGGFSAATAGTDYYAPGGTDIAATDGGTGQSSYAVGDILYASTTTALSKLADIATGNVLISGGVGVAPSYGKVGLTTHVSGTLPVGNGGTGATTLTGLVKGNGTSAFTAAVAGTDYYAPGGTDVAVADGGTGASDASGARTNLGLVIGTNVLAPNGNGSSLTGITQSQVANLTSDLALKAPLASPTFTGTVTVPTPTIGTDAANKTYVDNAVQGLSWKQAVRVASTANITIASALTNGSTIDGVTVSTGDRVLLKDQSTASQNGIYLVVASGAASRAADANTSAEVDSMTVYVEAGTASGDTVWTLTTNDPVLDTTSLVFAQVNGGAIPTASTTVEGKVELATLAEAEAKTDTTRALTAASVANFPIKKTFTIGDNSATQIDVTHSLGTKEVMTQVRQASDDVVVECDITNLSTTVVRLNFAVAPASNALKVVVIG